MRANLGIAGRRRSTVVVLTLSLGLVLVLLGAAPKPAAPAGAVTTSIAVPAGTEDLVKSLKGVKVSSTGATITLAGGQEVGLDFGDIAGGKRSISLGAIVFGIGALGRLLTTLGRLVKSS
ncbi:MAG: hypothetical protein WC971_06050 [Coriobacteriia bacterium]